ncbi:hypothetical protein M0802_014874 [Mischocyttarus mexicanus]|nr:hypothetical protein M0802_014874 [Mischocyttarus mexicanus]
MMGENFSENVGIEAPVITSPSGQAASDVDDRVKENIMRGKTLMQLGSLNSIARNISSTIDKEEIDDRRMNKEVINDRRIDVEDIIKVEDIINVEDIMNIEERNDRRIYTNKEVNIKEIDDKDLNVKKLVDEKVKDNVCSDKPCKGIGNEYSIEERFILEDTYEYEKLEGLGESMERLFDNDGLTDTETYDKGIDETLHNETIGEVHDKTTYADFCELLLEINTDEEFNAQRDPQKFENLLKGQGLGKKSDGIKEPIQSNNSFFMEKKFKNLIAPVRPYNTRAKSKQNQLPSPPTETTETEHLDETPATILPPPKYTYLPSPSRERLLLSPSPSKPQSPPPPSRRQLPSSPPPPIPLSRSPSPCPSSSSSYDSDEPNPCAVPRPAHSSPLLKIINSRDCLINRKDNLVIFISHQGKPIDKGALEFHDKCKLPKFEDIMPERAKVKNISRGKKLIALPIHYPPNKQNLVNTLKSLTLNLESALLDASRTQHTNGGTWSEDDIKSEVLKKFINGTNYLIWAELKQSENRDLTEAIENATIIEQNVMETDLGLLNRGKSNTPQDTRYGHKQFNVGNRDYHQNYRPNIVNRNSFRRYDRDNAYSNPRQGYVTENRQNYRPSYPNPPQEDYRDERPRNYRDNRNYEVDRNQKSHPPHYKYETDRRNAQSNNPPAGIRIALPPQTEITASDTGSKLNLIKEDFLTPGIIVDKSQNRLLQGISHETVFTLGTVTLKIFSKNINFHVISHNVPIPGNGILGDEFFEATQADFSYRKRHLFFDDIFIPFQDYEPLTIDAKETQKVEVIISNPETKVGLLERNKPIPGVYYEKIVVTPIQGRVIIDIVNDTDTAIIMKIPTLTILPLKEEVISVVEELESGGATSAVDNHTNETMMGENFSENVGIEAPVITSPSGQATSDVDDRVKENIMGGKTLMQLGSLNPIARNISSTIDKEEIDDRRMNKEVINDRRIDVEDIIKVEDIINVEDIMNIEERNDRRIYTNKELGSLNSIARNISSTIDKEEIDDRRMNKEVINDRRIDVEDIIKVEDIINVEDIMNIEERNDRRIYTNKEVNIKEIDDKDLNVKKLVDEKVKDNVCSDKPCKGIGNEYSIEERFILEDTYEYEKLEGLGESMERLFDNDGLTDTETYDKGIDETLHNKTIGEVHDKTTYADFCELLLEINTDEEFNAQRDPQKFENLLKGQGLGKKSDGIKEPIQSNNSFFMEKKFKNLIAPVRPYNTRAKSKQNQLPSPPTETTETEHLDETPATIPPPPKYTYLPSPSRERLLLSPSPSKPQSPPPPPSRRQLPSSPPPPIPKRQFSNFHISPRQTN